MKKNLFLIVAIISGLLITSACKKETKKKEKKSIHVQTTLEKKEVTEQEAIACYNLLGAIASNDLDKVKEKLESPEIRVENFINLTHCPPGILVFANECHTPLIFACTKKIETPKREAGKKTPFDERRKKAVKTANKIIELLLDTKGIDINNQDKDGISALSESCFCDKPDSVKILLKNKDINVNIRTRDGDTPLMYAAHRGHAKITRELLNHKYIEINLYNKHKQTALDIAKRSSHKYHDNYKAVTELLEEHGAKTYAELETDKEPATAHMDKDEEATATAISKK